MAQWLSQYWYLLIVLVAVIIVAAVIMCFAAKAYSKHTREFKKQDEELKRLLAIKEKFFDFSETTIEESSDSELLEGVALSYQLRLQKQEDPEKAFCELNEEKKSLYVLDVFCSDGDIQTFFSENGSILKDIFVPSLKKIGLEDFAEMADRIYCMYDEKNEEVSFSQKEIDKLNAYIAEEKIIEKIRLNAAGFIRSNCDLILN